VNAKEGRSKGVKELRSECKGVKELRSEGAKE